MFQNAHEKRPPSGVTVSEWSRATRPLPPRPHSLPPPLPVDIHKPQSRDRVPLRVWIIASASCFAVCGALVLATVVLTRWSTAERYSTQEVYEIPEPIFASYYPQVMPKTTPETTEPTEATTEEIDNEIQISILEKLPIFKNLPTREKKKIDLISKPQMHPLHDAIHHAERKIEKKDQAKLPDSLKNVDLTNVPEHEVKNKIINEINSHKDLPEFKPLSPYDKEVFNMAQNIEKEVFNIDHNVDEYSDYYNDDNLYEDYMQSNTMTSYLIEKVQELHDWITSDPDFERVKNSSKLIPSKTDFGEVLKALNESLLEGNATIVMNKLKDMYFDKDSGNHSRNVILTNSTELLSFGILTLDVMLLHNIQMMAWENQEAVRVKMLKDADVYAFNALFMDPSKVDPHHKDPQHATNNGALPKRQNARQDDIMDIGKNLVENVLEMGMSAARAAIHLGRAYKNIRNMLSELAGRDSNANQIPRNIDGSSHALNHLQNSYNKTSVASKGGEIYTELDCVWMLYCKNLVATAKLNAPYGTMARINGMALRMLAGELPAGKAVETLLFEALTGWTELKCNELFPRCSKVDAASVVLDSVLQPLKKSSNRGR